MKLVRSVKAIIPELREQSLIVANSYNWWQGGVIFDMLWCILRYGAKPIDYVRFEYHKKSSRERNRYLTVHRYSKLMKKFGYYNASTHGKISEYKTFSDYIKRPWIVADSQSDPELIRNFIHEQGVVFAKPNMGDQGKGVMKIYDKDNQSIEELLESCKKNAFVVEGSIEQSPEISLLNPSSLNTVRAYTMIKHNGETEIIGMMLRIGRKESHVDNWGAGGIGYDFDIETGICVGYGRDKKQNPYIFHPDSGIQMVGFRLPNYERLKQFVVELSQKVPQALFVGWDIAITPNGYELVEMNCPGGHDFLQAFGKPYGDVLMKELI